MKKLLRIHEKTNDDLGTHNKPNPNQKEIERLRKERGRLDARLQKLEQCGEVSTPEPKPQSKPEANLELLEVYEEKIWKKIDEDLTIMRRHWYQESMLEDKERETIMSRIGKNRSLLSRISRFRWHTEIQGDSYEDTKIYMKEDIIQTLRNLS